VYAYLLTKKKDYLQKNKLKLLNSYGADMRMETAFERFTVERFVINKYRYQKKLIFHEKSHPEIKKP
jgi:hypothetical protein